MKKLNRILIVLLSLIFVGCVSKKGAYEPVPVPRVVEVIKTDTIYVVKHDTVVLHDTIRIEVEKKVIEKEVEDPNIRVSEEKIALADGETNTMLMAMKFHVVVGSFKSKENAKKRQKEWMPAYTPTLVVNEQGMYRVILLSFDTYELAKAAVKDLSETLPKDTWVLRQKQ